MTPNERRLLCRLAAYVADRDRGHAVYLIEDLRKTVQREMGNQLTERVADQQAAETARHPSALDLKPGHDDGAVRTSVPAKGGPLFTPGEMRSAFAWADAVRRGLEDQLGRKVRVTIEPA